MNNATLEEVRQIFAKEMGVDDLSPQDDFFEAGGNSIMMVGIQLSIQERFGTMLPMETLFTYTTVESLCENTSL